MRHQGASGDRLGTLDLDYTFAFTPPAGSLVAHMETSRAGSVGFDATLSLERRPWNAVEVRRTLVRYPAMTAQVMAGIHWEALKLWWRGVPVVRRLTADGVGVEKYIFPGGELPSVGEMLKSLARTTSLSMYHAENCGTHYAHTLRAWRARFRNNLARVRALRFDDRFIRIWDLYLGSCEATFLERHAGLFQLRLVKNLAQRVLFNEPWSEPATRPHAAGASESAA